jgi:riboflavin synthase
VAISDDYIEVEAVEETLIKTTLGSFRPGLKVNLERAAKLGDRMGGHLVQGHVDCTGSIISIEKLSTGILIWISFPKEFEKYIVNAGSICVDGASLTAARVEENRFMISIIPHTWSVTTFSQMKPGQQVNLEFDIIGKYVEKIMNFQNKAEKKKTFLESFIDQPDF